MGPSLDDDDDFLDPDPGLATDEAGLRDLESRIEKLKQPQQGQALFAKGVALVTSIGFVLAGCLAGGFFLGNYLTVRTGSQVFTILGVVLGLAAAATAVFKLMGPFLKSSE